MANLKGALKFGNLSTIVKTALESNMNTALINKPGTDEYKTFPVTELSYPEKAKFVLFQDGSIGKLSRNGKTATMTNVILLME